MQHSKPEGELFSGEVEMLSAEGGAGEIAITPRHAPPVN